MSRLLDPRLISCNAQSLPRIHYSFFGLSDRVWKTRGFLPIEWPKNLWLECRGPRISVPLVLQWSSARTVTVSALNQYSPHFATQILWYACMQHETIINSRFSCTLDVNTTYHRNIACLRVCSQVKVHTPVSGSSTVQELLNSWIWSQFKKNIRRTKSKYKTNITVKLQMMVQ